MWWSQLYKWAYSYPKANLWTGNSLIKTYKNHNSIHIHAHIACL